MSEHAYVQNSIKSSLFLKIILRIKTENKTGTNKIGEAANMLWSFGSTRLSVTKSWSKVLVA